MIKLIHHNRHLIASMVARNLKARFAGTAMGILWSFFLPLVQVCIYTFVFSVIMHAKALGEYQHVPFPIWLCAGLLPWNMFSEGLGMAVGSITGNSHIVKKTMFDKRILPLCSVITSLVNHGIALSVLLVFMLFFGIRPGWTLLCLPLVSVIVFLWTLAWAYIVAALNVFLRDISQMVGVILNFCFFATPIVYSKDLVPPVFGMIVKANPFFYLLQAYREIILLNKLPNIFELCVVTAGITLFLSAAVYLFKILSYDFADSL